jgi:hypothetical protein
MLDVDGAASVCARSTSTAGIHAPATCVDTYHRSLRSERLQGRARHNLATGRAYQRPLRIAAELTARTYRVTL